MSVHALDRVDLPAGLDPAAPGPSAECPRCGGPLDPAELERGLAASVPVACGTCGAVLDG